jgi:hypothetical protein
MRSLDIIGNPVEAGEVPGDEVKDGVAPRLALRLAEEMERGLRGRLDRMDASA